LKKICKALAFLPLMMIYLTTLGLRIYWLEQKEGWNIDESLSVTLSCYNDYICTSNYPLNEEFQGKYIKEISLCDNDSLKNMFGDIRRLWHDNRDSPHTNFYYSLLRVSLAGLKTGDLKTITFRGGLLNIFLFTISFFVFLKLLTMLFKEKKWVYTALFCAFTSTATISSTMLLRSYQLQETFFIIFAYCFFKFLDTPKSILVGKELYVKLFLFLFLSVVSSLTLLTGYYSVFFIGLFGIYAIYYNKKHNRQTDIVVYCGILFLALFLAQAFYSRYLEGFISGRATETAKTITEIVNITTTFKAVATILFQYFFSLPVLIIIALILIALKIKTQKIFIPADAAIIFVIALLYALIVTFIAPYKILRYSMAVFPFFVFLPIVLIKSIKNQRLMMISIAALSFSFVFNAFNVNKIENLYRDKPSIYKFVQSPDIPVVVINIVNWKYAELVPYFNDEQTYIFTNSIDSISDKYSDFYLVVENNPEVREEINLENFEIKEDFICSYYLCKRLSLKKIL
jgi:hypothetical protein